MIKFTPSSLQLKDALEHVYYEITQLIFTLRWSSDTNLNNALIESRLIHVRALLDFFQKSGRKVMKGRELDDVLCLDYRRRWKVERLFAWLQNFRRIVVRY